MRQKRLNFRTREIARMTQAVNADETAHPVSVRLLCAQTQVTVSDPLAQLIQQARRAQWRRGAGFYIWLILYIHTVSTCQAALDKALRAGGRFG